MELGFKLTEHTHKHSATLPFYVFIFACITCAILPAYLFYFNGIRVPKGILICPWD